ncbi:MAG: hypothetical protein JXP73_08430 [Deltaproteobacteria bacterium]|nr:hypothetical protein [Deltaproteobacteria bacterium]
MRYQTLEVSRDGPDAPHWFFDCLCPVFSDIDLLVPPRLSCLEHKATKDIAAPEMVSASNPFDRWRRPDRGGDFDFVLPEKMGVEEVVSLLDALYRNTLYAMEEDDISQAMTWFEVSCAVREFRNEHFPELRLAEQKYAKDFWKALAEGTIVMGLQT